MNTSEFVFIPCRSAASNPIYTRGSLQMNSSDYILIHLNMPSKPTNTQLLANESSSMRIVILARSKYEPEWELNFHHCHRCFHYCRHHDHHHGDHHDYHHGDHLDHHRKLNLFLSFSSALSVHPRQLLPPSSSPMS